MEKKVRLTFNKTNYSFEFSSTNGDAFNWRLTYALYVDKEYSGYSLVIRQAGLSGDCTYELYTQGKLVKKIGVHESYRLPLHLVALAITAMHNHKIENESLIKQ